MSDITLIVNGEQKKANEKTLRVLAGVVNTANPGAETVKKAVELAGGEGYIAAFAGNGSPEDVLEVVQVGKSKGSTRTIHGKGTRQVIANRMKLALDAANWQTVIVTTTDGRIEKETGPELEMELI